MTSTNILARSAHDLGLAAWFGGTLMGAVAVNHSTRADRSSSQVALDGTPGSSSPSGIFSSAAWSSWTPVNAVAIGVHLVGGALLLRANAPRMSHQSGVASVSNAKFALTVAALAATGYARLLGQRLIDEEVPVVAGTANPDAGTVAKESEAPDSTASSVDQVSILQWAVPALTGLLIVTASILGEQQRPKAVAEGMLQRLTHLLPSLPNLPDLSNLPSPNFSALHHG